MRGGYGLDVVRKPMTGVAGCCVSPTSGHPVAAPLRSAINSRRLMRPPRRAGRLRIRPARGPRPSASFGMVTQLSNAGEETIVRGVPRPPTGSLVVPISGTDHEAGRTRILESRKGVIWEVFRPDCRRRPSPKPRRRLTSCWLDGPCNSYQSMPSSLRYSSLWRYRPGLDPY